MVGECWVGCADGSEYGLAQQPSKSCGWGELPIGVFDLKMTGMPPATLVSA
ncbi:hypothetical protein BFJ63_vAg18331 [Fusarium oxysporum f. sp. narcissi]|uniref:Uncharacterized protein n=1 Tax=Fusarium oxysporum f. sp. narcissi TaxID=451672 RepID=A0A4Q2UXN8_FUSOX|nr:hypothetical protein BFJ63_vAg18331 [Fusarium oxysporum f. sp. narcissi]